MLEADAVQGVGSGFGEADGQEYQGVSGFAEIKLPWISSSLIGRYDWFEWKGDHARSRIIAGYAYHFLKHCTVFADFDTLAGDGDDWWAGLTLEIHVP